VLLLFPRARNFTHIVPVYPAVKWRPGINWGSSLTSFNINVCLVLTGEANVHLSLSHLAVLRSLWNFGSTTSLHETCMDSPPASYYSPDPGGFACTRLEHLSGAQESQCCSLGDYNCLSTTLLYVRACVRACMCACVHPCVRACVRVCVHACVRVCMHALRILCVRHS